MKINMYMEYGRITLVVFVEEEEQGESYVQEISGSPSSTADGMDADIIREEEAKQLVVYMGVTRSPLPKNNGNLPLPFFGGNYSIVLLDNIYS